MAGRRKASTTYTTKAPLADHFATRAERLAAEEKRLRALATKLRTAAKRIDLAATYHGDGATSTSVALLVGGRKGERPANSLALEVVAALNTNRWRK